MSRRASLPGAEELFRTTAPAPAARPAPAVGAPVRPELPTGSRPWLRAAAHQPAAEPVQAPAAGAEGAPRPSSSSAAERRPSGRQRHEEKITVYLAPAELTDLERGRLTLRADHGISVDRGRIVREALALVLADLDRLGPDSVLVRRLRGD